MSCITSWMTSAEWGEKKKQVFRQLFCYAEWGWVLSSGYANKMLVCRVKCLCSRFSCRIRNHFPAIMHKSGTNRKVELIHERQWERGLRKQGTRHFSIINVLNGQIWCILTERHGKNVSTVSFPIYIHVLTSCTYFTLVVALHLA